MLPKIVQISQQILQQLVAYRSVYLDSFIHVCSLERQIHMRTNMFSLQQNCSPLLSILTIYVTYVT